MGAAADSLRVLTKKEAGELLILLQRLSISMRTSTPAANEEAITAYSAHRSPPSMQKAPVEGPEPGRIGRVIIHPISVKRVRILFVTVFLLIY